ncbi:MAG: hypothetical protein CVU66_01410 [Deltaproteobacteria bacterium HGW-Deltaproteobacteria-23]|nr:MAG: hypothetical protein CVU66_01410 [Deltaproteobacteria bacterium HGW-Deltaproteobacteria-23]
MRIFTILLFVAFLGTGSSFAAELDTYYLQQFGELPIAAKFALKDTPEPTVQKCGMPLKHDLKRDWKNLEPSTQKTLAKYLTKPTDTEYPYKFSSKQNHFVIHYKKTEPDAPPLTDTNSNTIPDWIETVADVFETVYQRETAEMGYSIPPGAPYDIYLKNMSYFGLTDPDVPSGQYPNSYTSYITIENDFAEHSFQVSIPGNDSAYNKSVKALQITAAHEFHHAIQFGINYYFENWYAEATSSWIEDEVYDSVNQLYTYANDYLANTATSLNSGSGYSRWIFNRSIFEQFYNQLYPRDIIWKIWEDFAVEPAPPSGLDIPMLPFIDKVLKSQGGSLPASFFEFAKTTYLNNWSSHTSEIARFNAVAPSRTLTADLFNAVQNPTLPAYSFTYYTFSNGTNRSSTITLNYPDKPAGYQVVAFKDSDKTAYNYDASTQTITIPDLAANDKIYLLICNNITIPNTTPTDSGGGGGGGGCFIATAAYGSYLHPEVMALRNFRDKYLLTNLPGRVLVATYYKISPPIADFIKEHESARFIVRILLTPVIFAVKHCWLALLAALILALTPFTLIRKTCTARSAPVH